MRRVSLFCAVGIALAILGLCVPAQAATYTYNALATDYGGTWGVWSNSNNWNSWPGNGGNAYTDTYDIAPDDVDGYPYDHLTIDSANPKGSWSFTDTSQGPFTVYASGGHYLDTTGGTIGMNAGGSTLTMSLPIQGTGSVSISNGNVSFSSADTNSYSGSTTVNGGASLTAPNYTSLPGYNVTGMVDVKGGATLSIGSGWSAGQMSDLLTYANWESGSSFGLDTTNGDVTTSASLTGLNLSVSGTHTLYLAGGTVTNGSLVVKGGTLNASDPILGTASINVYSGAAAILSGSNTYSGGTTINGTLTAVNRGALPGWNVPGKLSVNGTLILGVGDSGAGYFGASDVTTVLGNGFAGSAGIGFDTTGAPGGFSYTPALTGHPVVKQGANTLDLYGTMNQAITVNGGTMNVHNNVNFAYYTPVNVNNGVLNFMGNNTGSLANMTVASGGTLTLGGSNYGILSVNGGQLNLNNGSALLTSGILFLALSNATLDNTSGAPVTVGAGGNVGPVMQGTGMTFLGSNDLTFNPVGQFSNIYNGYGGGGPFGGPVWTMNVVQGNLTTANLRTSGFQAGNQIVKTGNGTWTLTGTPYDVEEPYVFTVNAGALVADSMVALFNKGNEPGGIVVNSGGAAGGRIGGPGGPGMSEIDLEVLRGNVTWAATGASLAIDTTNGDYTYIDDLPDPAGVSLGMTKLGPNALIFNVGKSYTGPTTISAGTLQFNDAAIGTGDVHNNGALVFNYTTGTVTVANNISGSGTLTKSGAGMVILSGGSLSYTGRTTIQGGTLEAVGAGGLGLLGGNGLDIQHGKAVLDYTGLIDPPTLDPIANTLMQQARANGWVIDGTHPIGSTTAAVDPLVHALGWTDTVVDGRTVLTVMYTLCGDANCDGVVNGADLNTVLSNYNKTGMYWSQGDFNYDGTVNGADLNSVLSNYNQSVSVGAAVPEPSTLMLAAAGLAGLLAYAWRKRK